MDIFRSEYPRPQFVRDNWINLNGKWQFSFDHGNSGEEREMYIPDFPYDEEIIVPFCPESKLSGIGCKDFMESVWYRRIITITKEHLLGHAILHFGAVDYRCVVYINGEKCGEHIGGFSSFSVDITAKVKEGSNILTVHAMDDIRSGDQPCGKQSRNYYSAWCDYTRVTGIWQTVWLEFVPVTYLKSVRIMTNNADKTVTFTAFPSGDVKLLSIVTKLFFKGEKVKDQKNEIGWGATSYVIKLDSIELWDVSQPNLYDITYELYSGDVLLDTVNSYFGFRSIEIRDQKIYLNGKPVFQRLVLDQGYYPDGIYTAPSDEALKRDIKISMDLGFNGARLHQKVFEERFLYWADQLGYLVWGEYGNWGVNANEVKTLANVLSEWLEVIDRDFNHPSIIGWCPFNEAYERDVRVIGSVYFATKAADPTRPVIDVSGYTHYKTDIWDTHDYEQDTKVYSERYSSFTNDKIYDPHEKVQTYSGQPFFVSEYGGIWWSTGKKEGWGYGTAPKTEEEFLDRYSGLTTALLKSSNVCAMCYTQLYDIEQEINGLFTYEREPKFSQEIYKEIRKINTQKAFFE